MTGTAELGNTFRQGDDPSLFNVRVAMTFASCAAASIARIRFTLAEFTETLGTVLAGSNGRLYLG